jgi:hypothetical protein
MRAAVGVICVAAWTLLAVGAARAADICTNGNPDGTLNGPSAPFTPCHFDSDAHITKILTYHWNNGRGAAAGSVALEHVQSGRRYGPFAVSTSSGQGGAANVYWTAEVDLTVPAGDYQILDSDVATWSWNPASQGNGIVVVTGELVSGRAPVAEQHGSRTDGGAPSAASAPRPVAVDGQHHARAAGVLRIAPRPRGPHFRL